MSFNVFVSIVGCAESWSLRASGQSFVNDIVYDSCFVMSLATLNPGILELAGIWAGVC